MNACAYAVASFGATSGSRLETENLRRSFAGLGLTTELSRTYAPVMPGTPAMRAANAATSGTRASADWVSEKRTGSWYVDGSGTPSRVAPMLDRFRRTSAEARYSEAWASATAIAIAGTRTSARSTIHLRRRRTSTYSLRPHAWFSPEASFTCPPVSAARPNDRRARRKRSLRQTKATSGVLARYPPKG